MSDVLYIDDYVSRVGNKLAEAKSFSTKKAARNAGLRNRTEWIRTGFAVRDGAVGVDVKGEVFYGEFECDAVLNVISAAARGMAPKKDAVAVQHDVKSFRRPVYRVSDLEVRRPALSELAGTDQPLGSSEIDELLSAAGHLGQIASAVRGCKGVDSEFYLSKLKTLLEENDCEMKWGYMELTANGGQSFWNYLVVDLPVGQFVIAHASEKMGIPAYPGDILDRTIVQNYVRRDALRQAFVEWVYSKCSGTSA